MSIANARQHVRLLNDAAARIGSGIPEKLRVKD